MANDFSLRRALTRRLAIALAVIGVIGTFTAYLFGSRLAIHSYDQEQFSNALTLADQVTTQDGLIRFRLPPIARKIFLADSVDKIVYRIVNLADGSVVDSSGALGEWRNDPAREDIPYFRDVQVGDANFHVAYLRHLAIPDGLPVLVEIGATTQERDRIIRSILLGTAGLMVAIVLTAVLVVRQGVNSVLAPLDALEVEATLRSSTNLTPLDLSKAPLEVRGLIQSINQMMSRLFESIGSQRRFIANAAHQLRTPVAGVRLQAEIALKNFPAGDVRENIREIVDSSTRATHVIEQLLALSRAEASELKAGSQPVDLTEISYRVIERHLQHAIRRQIDLGYRGVTEGAVVMGNEVLLAELVSNLVDNSILYGRAGGQVTVSTEVFADRVVLKVADNGPGIADFDAEKSFERFDRPDSASSGGAGLGLAIVKEIVQKSNAEMSVDTRPGEGTTFLISFERVAEPPAA